MNEKETESLNGKYIHCVKQLFIFIVQQIPIYLHHHIWNIYWIIQMKMGHKN